jgi:site-specific DNA-methyltransferase (adenine-specific)/modification methylase
MKKRLTPYYDHGGITIYCGDNRTIVPLLFPKPSKSVLVVGDPPYGVSEKTDRKTRKHICGGRDFPPCAGDDAQFDPTPWLVWPRLILWGANHYAHRLPVSPSWILWDKRVGTGADDNADGEMAWTNLGGPLRIFRHLWRGTCRASETGVPHVHPMQKPVALGTWTLQRWAKPGDTILVPWMGSGPDLAAVQAMQSQIPGLTAIGIELDERYCKAAANRLRQQSLPLAPAIKVPIALALPGLGGA